MSYEVRAKVLLKEAERDQKVLTDALDVMERFNRRTMEQSTSGEGQYDKTINLSSR